VSPLRRSVPPEVSLVRAPARTRVASRGITVVQRGATGLKPTNHDRLLYLPAASHCYAIVQYDPASARLVRRVVGLFGDAESAETYARDGGYHLYDIVPATAVILETP